LAVTSPGGRKKKKRWATPTAALGGPRRRPDAVTGLLGHG
jgi:hypothetical protein